MIRFVLYPLLFATTTVLLGLTAYRVHYTLSLDHPDVLTTSTHFYDPKIVALMVASIVGLVFSLAMIGLLVAGVHAALGEHITIWILWIFFLITAALVTERFSNLKWCRSHHKVCSVLETIKAFGWICWGILTILLVYTLVKLLLGTSQGGTRNRGAAAPAAVYPDTRQTTTSATVHDQPRTQPTQGVTAPHGAQTTKQNAHTINQQHQSPPTTTTAPAGAMYQQDIDHPPHTGPHIV